MPFPLQRDPVCFPYKIFSNMASEKRDLENVPVMDKSTVHDEYHIPIRLTCEDEEFLENFSDERRKKVLRKVLI